MKSKSRDILTGQHFINGDYACAEGAIAAGCRFFAGYPITPATEVAERMAQRLPEVGGMYIQMEDELASMAAIIGASVAGVKSMTSTSGPGFSLMMENIGLAIMMEVPCVVIDVMRGGPSTGLPTLVSQSDVMQARWGSHGDYEIIAYSPSSVQECFDLTIKAFNNAEKYRTPVIILTDEAIGHMTEKLTIPERDKLHIINRKRTRQSVSAYKPYKPDKDLVPAMAIAGEGYALHMTGLTHNEKGYPVIDSATQEKLVRRLIDKIRTNRDSIIEYEEIEIEDAEIVVVSYGISARSSLRAVKMAREEGLKVGMLRLITIWPFAGERIRQLGTKVKGFVVAEINQGQIGKEVQTALRSELPVVFVNRMGGDILSPQEILEGIWKLK